MPKRSARLDNATVMAAVTFRPQPRFLTRWSDAYVPLSFTAARDLVGIVKRYLVNLQLERAAPKLKGAVDRIREMAEAARQFSDVLAYRGARSPETDEEIAQADAAERFINERRGVPEDFDTPPVIGFFNKRSPLTRYQLWEEALDFAQTAARCADDLESGAVAVAGFRDGEAWQMFVADLLSWAHEYEYPDTIRQDADASPIVHLVTAINAELPEEFRQHSWSLYATAKAITRARQAARNQAG